MVIPPANVATRAIWLEMRLNDRDLAILETVHRLGLVTGLQIEKLHFADIHSSFRVRNRVMLRLVESRALIKLSRRVGGSYGGSSAAIYALDPAADLLIHARKGRPLLKSNRGPQHLPPRLHSHILMVSDFYVGICLLAREYSTFNVADFRTEPACWWPTDDGEYIKPDAYLAVANSEVTDHWWIEADQGTENNETLRDKFSAYLDFADSRFPGPGGVIPRVLVIVPDGTRKAAIARIRENLPSPAEELFFVSTADTGPEIPARHIAPGNTQ